MDNKKKKEKKAPLPPPPPPPFLFCGYLISWKITFGKNHFVNFDFQAYPLKNPRVTISFPTKKRFFQAVLERTPGNISNKHFSVPICLPWSVPFIGFWVPPPHPPEGGSPTPLPRTPFRNIYIYILGLAQHLKGGEGAWYESRKMRRS